MPAYGSRSATDLAAAVRTGELAPTALVDAALDRIDDDPDNAFVTVLHDRARDRARALEERLAADEAVGPLVGVPVGIKDLSQPIEGVRLTNGAKPLADNVADRTCAVVERLEAAGAVVVGTTNTPELGHTTRTYNEHVGPTSTPFDPEGEHNAGGSSGGSAAALGGGLVPLATGSDIGGSLRAPASCCGVVSVKPSFGLVPHDVRPNGFGADPFPVNGPMARTVEDLALMLTVLAGRDDRDPQSAPLDPDGPETDYTGVEPLTDVRVALSGDLGMFAVEERVRDVVRDAVGDLADAGATVEEPALSLPDYGSLVYAYGVMTTVGMAASARSIREELGVDLEADPDAVSETFLQTLALGTGYEGVEVRHQNTIRTDLYDAIEALLDEYDVLACPTLATPPLTHDEPYPQSVDGKPTNGLVTDWNLCWPFNMTGHPVVNVPAGLVDGLPVGMQLVGRRFDERTLLGVARALERERPWADDYPRRDR